MELFFLQLHQQHCPISATEPERGQWINGNASTQSAYFCLLIFDIFYWNFWKTSALVSGFSFCFCGTTLTIQGSHFLYLNMSSYSVKFESRWNGCCFSAIGWPGIVICNQQLKGDSLFVPVSINHRFMSQTVLTAFVINYFIGELCSLHTEDAFVHGQTTGKLCHGINLTINVLQTVKADRNSHSHSHTNIHAHTHTHWHKRD